MLELNKIISLILFSLNIRSFLSNKALIVYNSVVFPQPLFPYTVDVCVSAKISSAESLAVLNPFICMLLILNRINCTPPYKNIQLFVLYHMY